MSRFVTLPIQDGQITLKAGDRGWCEVSVIASNHRRRLGFESLVAIADRILAKAPYDGEPIGEIGEIPVINLFNVSNPHGAIYLEAASKPIRRLFFQDAEAVVVHASSVSAEQLETWQSRLSTFAEDRG